MLFRLKLCELLLASYGASYAVRFLQILTDGNCNSLTVCAPSCSAHDLGQGNAYGAALCDICLHPPKHEDHF
ncbi:unnamed protein product [Lathyrus sativus]|nr:unnamed protein product [Lathyrus sativus]